MITVYHLNRSRSLRILWLLEELGVDHTVERFERDATTGLAPPELRALHPLGKSPMIRIDGQLVTESAAIVEVICAAHAPEMVPPVGTEAYIRHLELMHFAEGSAMTPILLNLYISRLKEAGEPLRPRIESELHSHFSYMETQLRPSGHFVLDQFSAVDVMLSFPAQIMQRYGMGAEFPKLSGFVDALQSRPAFQRAVEAAGGD